MRAEKDGYVIHLEGTWMEISNRYGVLEYGDVDVIPENAMEGYAEKLLDDFIDRHSVKDTDTFNKFVVKRVAFDLFRKEYIQLRAIRGRDEIWMVQEYDNELVFMKEIWSGCKYRDEVLDWIRKNYEIESCLMANVFRSGLGDYTNGGISATRCKLYILAATKGLFEPQDIRECVYVEWHEVMGEEYINCKPAYFPKRRYTAGRNFLYTSDGMFKKITKSKYPIPIHDRY